MPSAPQPASNSAAPSASQTPSPTAATPVAAPAMTVEQQVAQIRMKLAEHTIGSDNNTHRVNNPIWDEKENH